MSSRSQNLFCLFRKHWPLPVLLFLGVHCGGPVTHQTSGQTMGTFFQVTIVADGNRDWATIDEGIGSHLTQIDQLMSNWIPDSEISRFNQYRGEQPFPLSKPTAEVLKKTLEIAELTKGAFDPTISPLIELWGFGTAAKDGIPDPEVLARIRSQTGFQNLVLMEGKVGKTIPELTVNLSALAKGYAVDTLFDYLNSLKLKHFMVNIGGEVRVSGRNPKKAPWRLGIEVPDSERIRFIYKVAHLTDKAMATSGDYRNFFYHEGKTYSHILDPRTGYPITTGITSATVLADDCMTADAFATALMVLDPTEGLSLVASLPGVECLILVRDEQNNLTEHQSTGFKSFILPQ